MFWKQNKEYYEDDRCFHADNANDGMTLLLAGLNDAIDDNDDDDNANDDFKQPGSQQ